MVTTTQARAVILALLLSPLVASPGLAAVLDPNWTETIWFNEPSQVTGMAWAPDGSGRLFLTHKTGEIRIVDYGPPPTLVATNFATVSPVFTDAECGLIGIAFDPDFSTNGYVYVFVTVSATQQQVIRYTASGNTGTNKTIIIPGLPTAGSDHDGGGLGIGRDGKIYWSIGDLGNGTGVDANLTSLAAKVGRANRDGTSPADNPFADGSGPNNDYVLARGFRNPYTLTFQPTTGKPWIDVTGELYEQVFVIETGGHAGWNDFDNNQPAGYTAPVIKYRTNGRDTRTLSPGGTVRSGDVVTFTTTVNHGFRQGEKIEITGSSDSSFNGTYYVASAPQVGTTFTVAQVGPDASSGGGTAATQNQGGAITGGAFYDATGAPVEYRGNFFFGDFNSGRINRAIVGPGTSVTAVDYFATGHTRAIDVSVGPDGALYYVNHDGTIRRAAYHATSQDLIVSPSHLWTDQGGNAVFAVHLAAAPTEDVTVTVVRSAGSSRIDVSSGASLTFTSANFATFQPVTIVADADSGTDAATFSVASEGLDAQSVVVNAAIGPLLAYEHPGRSVRLTLGKNATDPNDLDLDWGPSCGSAWDYSVHQGTIGDWYSHDRMLCGTEGATVATITPGPGSHYYLVVPLDHMSEGSYGSDGLGADRPPSGSPCRPRGDPTPCP